MNFIHNENVEKPPRRGRHRVDVENNIIFRREKELNHQQLWSGASKYFEQWQRKNTKFEEWTSPRYYANNNKLIDEVKTKRVKEELLEKRQSKLRKLLREEEESYQIELMVQRNKPKRERNSEEVPTDILKEINSEIKLKEDDRRRHEAELKLYHQWRINNPIVRQYESKFRHKDLKLSWLDQQIEKRMQKEREERENKRLLKEHEEKIIKQEEEQKSFERYVKEKQAQLKACLDKQLEEIDKRRKLEEQLRKIEFEEMKKKTLLEEIEEKRQAEEKRRKTCECALYNIRQYKLKLKTKAANIEENLIQEQILLENLKQLRIEEMAENREKQNRMKEELENLTKCLNRQKTLEKQRQRHLEFLFDSEARSVYEKQSETWRQEEQSRQRLLDNVLKTLGQQVRDKLKLNDERRMELELEQKEIRMKVEEYERELKRLKEEEERKKVCVKFDLDEEVKVKNARKQLEENYKLKEINEELDRIRKEEDKLQQEIARIQSARRPQTRRTSSRFF